MRKIIVTAAAVLLATGGVVYSDPGESAASFLRIGVGAKPAAMGEAYAGVTGDLMSLYSNPAGLSTLFGYEFGFSHAIWFEDISYSNIAAGGNMLDGYVALGVNYLSVGSIRKADNLGNRLQSSYTPSDLLITAGYARIIGDISAGAALKIIHSEIDGDSATGVAVDLGAQKYFGVLNAGVVIQNLGTPMEFRSESDPLPLAVRAGISYPFLLSGLDITAVSEAAYSNEVPFTFNAGVNADYPVSEFILSLRVGFKSNAEGLDALSRLTTGFGVEYADIAFDYSFASFEDLGMTHRISLGYRM